MTVPCGCGAVPIGPMGVCPSCEDDLRDLLYPADRAGVLRQIAAIARAAGDDRVLTLAQHGLNLKG